MKPAGLLIIVFTLAVIADARVALLPGWVVPVPAVFLAVTLAAAAMFAALIVMRLRFDWVPLAPGGGAGHGRGGGPVTMEATVAARPGWREGSRQDRLVRAQIALDREAARAQARIAEREAAARVKLDAVAARRDARAAASTIRAARLAALGQWAAAHVVELLFVPVIGVPALLSWTAMSSFGARLYGPPGYTLPAFSEGAMWAFAAAVTLTLHRHPGRPVWHLRTGIVVFAVFGAGLNYVHGLTIPPFPGLPPGPLTGAVMAVVSVAGVTAHQLVTAGPRSRIRRPRSEPAPAAAGHSDSAPEVHPAPAPGADPGRTRTRTPGAPAARTPGARTPVTDEYAEAHFADDLAAGRVPSQRQIKTELHVGQDRARQIHDHLAARAA